MTRSASTSRVRLTLLFYLLVLALAAVSEGRALESAAGLAAQAAGFALVVAAVLWRLWCTLFIAGRKDERVVRDGPYAACRHPLYLGSIVGALGIGLSTRSLALTVAVPLVVTAAALVAARREDHQLALAHGDAFAAYREAVPAFRPSGRPLVPGTVTVSPAIYRKAFLDAASFLALWFLVLLLDNLRAGGAWSAYFRLP